MHTSLAVLLALLFVSNLPAAVLQAGAGLNGNAVIEEEKCHVLAGKGGASSGTGR